MSNCEDCLFYGRDWDDFKKKCNQIQKFMQALQSHALKKVSPISFHFEIPDVTGNILSFDRYSLSVSLEQQDALSPCFWRQSWNYITRILCQQRSLNSLTSDNFILVIGCVRVSIQWCNRCKKEGTVMQSYGSLSVLQHKRAIIKACNIGHHNHWIW